MTNEDYINRFIQKQRLFGYAVTLSEIARLIVIQKKSRANEGYADICHICLQTDYFGDLPKCDKHIGKRDKRYSPYCERATSNWLNIVPRKDIEFILSSLANDGYLKTLDALLTHGGFVG